MRLQRALSPAAGRELALRVRAAAVDGARPGRQARRLEDATRFDPSRGTVRAWLLGCARHVVLDRLRAEGRWAADAAVDDGPSTPCPAEDAVFTEQRLAQLHAAILSLPVEYREAVA